MGEVIRQKGQRLTMGHLGALKDSLLMDAFDAKWLLTKSHVSESEVSQPISSVPLCLLIRLLDRMPDKNPLPSTPIAPEVIEAISPYWPEKRQLTARKFSLLTGNASWSGTRWLQPASDQGTAMPAHPTQRLFLLLKMIVEEMGDDGIEEVLDIVEEEANARGIRGGWKELVRRGTWSTGEDQKDD